MYAWARVKAGGQRLRWSCMTEGLFKHILICTQTQSVRQHENERLLTDFVEA